MQIGPVGSFVQQFGVRSIIYGPPNAGKTRLVLTAPNALYVPVENTFSSLRHENIASVPVLDSTQKLEQFFAWVYGSAEVAKYDTLFIDSASHIVKLLRDEETNKLSKSGNKVDGKAAYGEILRRFMGWVNPLYYMRGKHIVLIGQETSEEAGPKKEPYFPGKAIKTEIMHQYDAILRLADTDIPGVGRVRALQSKDSYTAFARDKLGRLADYEPADLSTLFTKLMS